MHMDFDDTRTIPLTELIATEAWQAYVRESNEVPSADGFVRWVKANEPDILRVLKEPALNAVANALVHERARDRRSATS